MMRLPLLRHPSAFLPVMMSVGAISVLAVALAVRGLHAPPEADEGTAAHLWQLLIGGQLPIVGFFALKWFPRAPRETFQVLVLQALLGVLAVAPVYLLHL